MHHSVPTLIVGGWTRVPAWNKYPQNCTNVKKPVNRSQANVKTEGKKKEEKVHWQRTLGYPEML